jgi:long-chain fatty acid transport protein
MLSPHLLANRTTHAHSTSAHSLESPWKRLAWAFTLVCGISQAGVIDNRSNLSATYIRQLARAADSRFPDAAAYDPAATAWIAPGWHLELDNQSLMKYNKNFTDRFAFTSDLLSPVLPTGFAVYRKNQWSGFLSGTLVGGGGNLHYDKGSVTLYPVVAALSTANPATAPDLQLSSLYWAATMGGAYAWKPWLSASIAARYVIASTQIKGEARGNNFLDHEETAAYPTLMFGLHVKPNDKLDIGMRYENITKLEWEVQKSDLQLNEVMAAPFATAFTKTIRGSLPDQGNTFNRDLPPVAALGLGYRFTKHLRVDVSETFYWQTIADWGVEDDLVDNGWETAIGIEVSPIPERWMLTASAMKTMTGANSETYTAESPALDGYTLGGGTRFQWTPKFAFDLGVAYSGTEDDDVTIPGLGAVDLKKHTWVYAFSVGLHLP